MRATLRKCLITWVGLACVGLVVARAPADEIEDIISQVTLEEYKSYLLVLTGVRPIPFSLPPYYLTDRYSFGYDIQVAGEWIHDHFAALGLDTSLHVFDSSYGPNVIGELPGLTAPDDIYILCAHYDTVAGTPGCDDNGSGTAAVMLAAGVLSQYEFDGTLRFIAFSGEEQWMVGSQAYAAAAYAAGENIVAVINLDMLLHPSFDDMEPDPDHDLDIGGNTASQWLGEHLAEQFAAYTSIDVQLDDSGFVSNQWSFWPYGYDAVGVLENTPSEIWGGSIDCYHSACDVMTNPHYEWDFGLEAVRGSMAGVVTLAMVLNCAGDYDCDGFADEADNCPLHWNPDQADCDEDGSGDTCTIAECVGETWCGDCNENGVPDGCDIADVTSDDYDLNGVPDECDPDCNENGVPDACDLDCGTGDCTDHPLGCGGSEDCQPNGVPDECDIDPSDPDGDGEVSEDADGNGIPDECCQTRPGDFDQDDRVDGIDIAPFVACFLQGPSVVPGCECADMNMPPDGVLDDEDVTLFVTEMLGG